jgi:hypothetical protein
MPRILLLLLLRMCVVQELHVWQHTEVVFSS